MADDPALAPLKPPDAKALARDIAENGTVEYSGHSLVEMKKDELETTDCLNLIRAGVYQPPELEKGELRYRISTPRMCIVIVFLSETRLRVITAWRNER